LTRKTDNQSDNAAAAQSVESGSEDIAPDQFSSGACPGWRKDPKALDQQLAAY
jgi:hypothetical protein